MQQRRQNAASVSNQFFLSLVYGCGRDVWFEETKDPLNTLLTSPLLKDGAAQESQYELRKRQLTAELASVELKLNQKKKLIQSKRRSTIGSIGDGILSDSKKSRRRKLVEADLDNTLGNDGT
jgi:hypothetical protein